MKSKLLILACLSFLLFSCSDNEDVVKQPNKDGSIETTMSTEHRAGYDLLITQHKIWVYGALDKVITTVDTLKNLGFTMAEGSSNNEDSDGKMVNVPKDYEIYITVK